MNKNIINYNILQKFVAGIALEGWEVKVIKFTKNIDIKSSYIKIIKNEAFVKNIFFYSKDTHQKKINRVKKLLLKKNEIKKILEKINNNFKVIPLNFFLKKNIIKLNIAIVLRKKNFFLKNDREKKIPIKGKQCFQF